MLVHGWPQHWFAWRDIIAALAGSARFLVIDLRGFGWSTPALPEESTITGLASDIVGVLDHFAIPTAHLAAQDWGGWIGFRAVLSHPGRFWSYTALSIVPPWLDRWSMLRHAAGWSYIVPMAVAGDGIANWSGAVRWLVDHSTHAPAWADVCGRAAIASYLDRIGQAESAIMTRRLYAALVRHEIRTACGRRPDRLQVPTTVMVGDHETISRPDLFWNRTYPTEIGVVTVAEARHWLSEEQPQAVIDVLRGRLATAMPLSQ